MLQSHAPAIFSVIVFILIRFRISTDNTICMHFHFDHLLSRAFSNRCVFDENAQSIRADGRPKCIKNVRDFKEKRICVDEVLDYTRDLRYKN